MHGHGSACRKFVLTFLQPSRSESEERRAAEEEAAHEDTRRRGLQPTLGQVSSMAAEAQDLPVDQELRARLEGLVAAAEDWEARASGVLYPKKVLPQASHMHPPRKRGQQDMCYGIRRAQQPAFLVACVHTRGLSAHDGNASDK